MATFLCWVGIWVLVCVEMMPAVCGSCGRKLHLYCSCLRETDMLVETTDMFHLSSAAGSNRMLLCYDVTRFRAASA